MTKSPWYRLSLSLLMTAAVAWFWHGRLDELTYHTFASDELIEIGDAKSFESARDQIPENAYVAVTGILGNKAATLRGLRSGSLRFGRYQVRHLLGSKIYIEYDENLFHSQFSPFTQVSVKGRLMPFRPDGELSKVHEFFRSYYKKPIDKNAVLIVVNEKPRSEMIYPLLFIVTLLLVGLSYFFSIRGFMRKDEKENDQED